MRMTDRGRERIGRIRLDLLPQPENHSDHTLHLRLFRAAATDDRLLDMPRRVFEYRQLGMKGGAERGRARLAQFQRAARVAMHEDAFDRDLRRLEFPDDFSKLRKDAAQSCAVIA